MKFVFLLLALVGSSAWAQSDTNSATPTDASAQTEGSGETKVMKKIVVLGSYVKKTTPPEKGTTPVTVIDSTKMLETGTYTVSDALQEDVAFSSVDAGAFIALHGQTSADNLILLNGLRIPMTAGSDSVNIDFLPASAIERVETLKDGASALYGSEAMSGVVNIVTKKDYDGANFLYRMSSPQIGAHQEADVGATIGKTYGKHHVMAIAQLRMDTPLYEADIPGRGPSNYNDPRNPLVDPYLYGNLFDTTSGTPYFGNCPNGRVSPSGTCVGDTQPWDEASTGNARRYYMTYLGYAYDIDPTSRVDVLAMYTRRHWEAVSAARAMDFADLSATGQPNYSIPVGIANGWGVHDAQGNPAAFTTNPELLYRPTEELGAVNSTRDVDNYVVQASYDKQFGKWDLNFSSAYGLTYFKDVTTQGEARPSMIFSAIQGGTFNPFKPSGAKDDLRFASIEPWFAHTSDNLNPRIVVTGPLGAGFSIATGIEGQWQSFKYRNDPWSLMGDTLSGQASNQEGSRSVYSGFMEIDYNPIKQLELQLAGRFDHYSDFGDTINPKLGIAYNVNDALTFRASYGTGFKAPDLLSVYQGQATDREQFRDEVQCKIDDTSNDCNNGTWTVTRAGNRHLDAEKGKQYNVGFVATPKSNLIFGADYWWVDGRDGLSDVDPGLATLAESLGYDLSQYGITTTRDGSQRITSIFIPAKVNAGTYFIRGIDFNIHKSGMWHSKTFGPISTKLSIEHSHTLAGGGTDFPITPLRWSYDLDWKNVVGFTMSQDKNLVQIQARTFSAFDANTASGRNWGVGKGSTSVYTLYDLHYERFLKNESSVQFGIKNLFDYKNTFERDGYKFAITDQGLSPFYALGLGRIFYVGYNKEF